MFNDLFKKDFIEVAGMKARRKLRKIVRATLALAQNSLQHSDSLRLWGPELGC